jgi:beta-galactosidase/beta-glucuronidase
LLQRAAWTSLDGTWEFALDPEARWRRPDEVSFDREIVVPFAPETPASGLAQQGFFKACWYRRRVEARPAPGRRLLLHFGAVDHRATVWAGGAVVVQHEGGYTPFSADVTDALEADAALTLVVRAEDDPHDLEQPRGKQDWLPEPHGIWYPRTTGVWQTVWLEEVPQTRIEGLRLAGDRDRFDVGVEAAIAGPLPDGLRLRVRLRHGDRVLADDLYAVTGDELRRRIELPDPGIDDARRALAWSPERPVVLDADVELVGADGAVVDVVSSYTALRSVAVDGERFLLNGRPYPLRLVLDQGYWPESGLTAPDVGALRRDVELVQALGFNGVRKHQKVEDPRFLHLADRLGLLVWGEMPSAYRFGRRAVRRVTREWVEVLERDAAHPCLVAWVPLNESWGVPDLPRDPAQRAYARALYELTKALDPTRPVIGNDGWEAVATDLVGIHDYDADPGALAARYAGRDVAELLSRERPGGRVLTIDPAAAAGRPIALTEFGGIAHGGDEQGWGYSRARTAEDFLARYQALLAAVHRLPLAGFCYTQLTDCYQEVNGLLSADRTPKAPIEALARATRGDAG